MNVKQITVLVASLFLFTSCQALMDRLQPILNPSAKPEMIAAVKDKADAIAFSSPKKLGWSSKNRMKLEEGQWVTTLTTHSDQGNDRELATTRVIQVEGDTVVLETESYSASDNCERQLTRITFKGFPIKSRLAYSQDEVNESLQNIQVVKVLTKHGDDPVREVPEKALAMYGGIGKSMAGMTMDSGELSSGDCETQYIRSSRCYSFDYTVSVMGITQSGHVTAHSKIPVNGLVRMEAGTMVQETIAFGTSGAKSQF